MYIQSVDPNKKLVSLVSSIGRDPLSWKGWSCLYLDLSEISEDKKNECFLWIKSIVDAYFGDVEGHVYACHGLDVHIICKNVSHEMLEQAARQICDLAKDESDSRLYFQIYNLAKEAFDYIQIVLDKEGEGHKTESIVKNSPHPAADTFSTAPVTANQNIIRKVKVLLVEDDPVVRWMVRNALKNDCDFATAPTANKAFSLYSSYKPDIVFLDIGLPDKSGRDVLAWIMRNDPGACVVMFSSNNNLDNIAGALEDGASGFISKPFLKDSLIHYINNCARY